MVAIVVIVSVVPSVIFTTTPSKRLNNGLGVGKLTTMNMMIDTSCTGIAPRRIASRSFAFS